ncbi:MAG: rhomboid family intramembrane serine protease, partial [Dehalococcoidia bacterium]
LFYLAAGVAAVWLQIAVDTTSQTPTIGASGAIAGVLGAYLLLFPLNRVRTVVVFFFFINIIKIPAFVLLGFWFALQFFSGVGSLGIPGQGGGVAYWAHIGGFLMGVMVVVIYKLATHQRMWPRGPGGRSDEEVEVPQYWRGRRL